MSIRSELQGLNGDIISVMELLEVLRAMGNGEDCDILGTIVNTADFRDTFLEAAYQRVRGVNDRLCRLGAKNTPNGGREKVADPVA